MNDLNMWFEKVYDAVKMRDVISMYTTERTGAKSGRVACPLHGGKDKNFAYAEDVYHCWVCGAKGNIITFVSEMFGLNSVDALKKIDTDFNLGIVGEHYKPSEKRKEMTKADMIRAEEYKKSKLDEKYKMACDELNEVNKSILRAAIENDFDAVAKLCDRKHELDYLIDELWEVLTSE